MYPIISGSLGDNMKNKVCKWLAVYRRFLKNHRALLVCIPTKTASVKWFYAFSCLHFDKLYK